jgi:uncharacterized protein YabE (DUF348 family)
MANTMNTTSCHISPPTATPPCWKVRLGLGFAVEVCEATEQGVNAKYKDDATETTTAAAAVCLVLARNLAAVDAADVLDPAAIVEGVK